MSTWRARLLALLMVVALLLAVTGPAAMADHIFDNHNDIHHNGIFDDNDNHNNGVFNDDNDNFDNGCIGVETNNGGDNCIGVGSADNGDFFDNNTNIDRFSLNPGDCVRIDEDEIICNVNGNIERFNV
jgi:hypothetical protein